MTRLPLIVVLLAAGLLAALSLLPRGEGQATVALAPEPIQMGIDPETTGNSANTLGALESCARVNVAAPTFDGIDDDGDGWVNDGCPAVDTAETACEDAVDDDEDGRSTMAV